MLLLLYAPQPAALVSFPNEAPAASAVSVTRTPRYVLHLVTVTNNTITLASQSEQQIRCRCVSRIRRRIAGQFGTNTTFYE